MINVVFLNGFGLIFNANDFYELRTKHRIIGEFWGSTKTSQIALPVALSPEQVNFLQKKSIIKLVEYLKITEEPSDEDKIKYEEYVRNSYEEQRILLREERQKQIELNIDKILKGRDKPREIIIKEELNKLPDLEKDNILNAIYTEHPQYLKDPPREIQINSSTTKQLVFNDLWAKNYYITSGRKFGGDFLVYYGDPVLFHAFCIVKCLETSINVSEIVRLGRLGHSVKKKFVLANVINNCVKYITTDWLDD